ncbi:hypothetical protein BDV25DRAFT_171552 [Aspergillus avenaceus]|uniref:ADP-ribose 1''-phosphate phosphatase n=1 Tax=Aspergillus avenaceus TaxID=36643 RepID=A0A5N6TDG7_ASPAV|nr:hypothetical protein BDV25DRAFT_171552 [Aspergillus avenaceus]
MAQFPTKVEDQTLSCSSAVDSTDQTENKLLYQEPASEEKEVQAESYTYPTNSRQLASGENRLRPAADVLNRIIWDESFNSDDYTICYEDRFEGRLEASLDSWKKDSTDEEFIPQHRILYVKRRSDASLTNLSLWEMFSKRRRKLDLSLLQRRHSSSAVSSTSLSPTIPTLESPVTFHALTSRTISEATMSQRNKLEKMPARPSMFIEETDEDCSMAPVLTRCVAPGPASIDALSNTVEEDPAVRTKTQYFEDVFNTRGPELSPRAQVNQESVIVAELKLNKLVGDDDSLAAALASRLARIYQKPESSMMVTIQQDACVRFGISKGPAYLLKIFTLPYLIGSITNLRNTILIQAAMRELLEITPNRGVVLYTAVPDENFATNNATYMAEVTRHARQSEDGDPGILRTISRNLSRRPKSNSTQSAPLSDATTSSWAPEADTRPRKAQGSQSSDLSRDGDASARPRSLRQFLSPTFFVMAPTIVDGRITEIQGSIFDAPDGAALIHACNCVGSWGKGVARSFKKKYPAAYAIYRAHCQKLQRAPEHQTVSDTSPETDAQGSTTRTIQLPEGTALIIPPHVGDYNRNEKKHWIICLFTSRHYGKRATSAENIIHNTELAVADMVKQLDELRTEESQTMAISELWSCRFNSGLFAVNWEHSRRVLEKSGLCVTVVRPVDED